MSVAQQYIASFAVGLGTYVGGFSSAYTSPAIISMARDPTLDVTVQDVSWIGSLQPLFALFGSFVGGFLLEHIGRKKTIILGRIPFIVAFIMIFFATDVKLIMLGRICAGLGVGIETLSSPIYLSETIDPEMRGRLGIFPTVMGNLGVLTAYVLGAFMEWRALAIAGSLLPLPFFLFAWFLPESYTWIRSREEKRNSSTSGKTRTCAFFQDTAKSWVIIFGRSTMGALIICLLLQFFQQFIGINAIIYYSVAIFESSESTIDSFVGAIVIGVVNLVSTVIATVLVDRAGRRMLLLISAGMMTVSLLLMGVFCHLIKFKAVPDGFGWIPLTVLVTYVFGFSIGYGPLPWLMMGELLPKKIRGNAASFVTAFHWLCTFVVTKTFVDVRYNYGDHVGFYGFTLIGVAALVFMLWVPETKGRSLEDIEKDMIKEKPKKQPPQEKGDSVAPPADPAQDQE